MGTGVTNEISNLGSPFGGQGAVGQGADVSIIGGGLAGLSLSIQLAKACYRVILCEKEKYPFHIFCGEYICLESWDFIVSL